MKALHNAPLYQYLSTLQQPFVQREVLGFYGFTVLRFYGFTVLHGNHKGMPLQGIVRICHFAVNL
jgi:hypothetical protein